VSATVAGSFAGQVALVTGGTRGIGRAVAQMLHDGGADVVVTGRALAAAEEAARAIGPRASAVALELGDPAQIRAATAEVLAKKGAVDVLVNNAGISGPIARAVDYPWDEWRRVMATNLDGTFLMTQALLPGMLGKKYGRIVNVASIAGKEGNPQMPAYSASKAGLIGLTKSLGKELATSGVLVNVVAPGVVETEILDGLPKAAIEALVAKIPMGRMGRAEECAALVVWLASRACSFATGAVFDLSGGRATY
jgi:3-oxoacyl-[acyl-carrier protein] reductase